MSARLNMPGETLCSILDNAAALGQADKLRAFSERCARRANRVQSLTVRGFQMAAEHAWVCAAAAARHRAIAVKCRLDGRIARAVEAERDSANWESRFRALSTFDDNKHVPGRWRVEA